MVCQIHFLKYFALLSLLILCATVTIHHVDAGVLHETPCNSTSETQTTTESSSGLLPDKCGVCCPKSYQPVCGTDGVTYDNEFCLNNAICHSEGKIQKAHDGDC